MTGITFLLTAKQPAQPRKEWRSLKFGIVSVKCLDETNGKYVEKIGKDEIYLGGAAVDATGKTHRIPAFRVGTFDDGDVKRYPHVRRMHRFDLRAGPAFPKAYFVTLVLVEKDSGKLSKSFDGFFDMVEESVQRDPTPKGIGQALDFVAGKGLAKLKRVLGDDVFPSRTATVKLRSQKALFAGLSDEKTGILIFKGHQGKYEVKYEWELTDPVD